MYEYVKGKLVMSNPLYVVIDVQGVGYKVLIPIRSVGKLPEMGREIFLFTSWVVREISHTLYGFILKEERDLFELLITFSGIGPKTALGIMGHLEIGELQSAVRSHNIALLSKVPGIGKKTAERLMVDLKGKLDLFAFDAQTASLPNKLQDALNALIHLGYSQSHAEKAIKKASESLSQENELSEWISLALKLRV